ncbi:RagB/SusD family nutrient uptake outer membrane protein [Chondrinema litorale]|uniref:RagB/SusD family nutrient uptake outer membrane protein n=1 Tax=Chondrinema litorale TaxID=2994555 RepID=UPI0025433062|nr:RagB/SusD family nutrient uptake outer membrane protein [Chondrinema litorale]UZR98415.1 RagB/SusD family nutrient uptake outer membrane protein [Chondrinema litorale]
MTKTQNRFLWILCVCSLVFASACEDFLEKPESSDVTKEEIFSDQINAEKFLWETYNTCVPRGFPYQWDRYNGMYASMLAAACDEADVTASWTGSNNHNVGNVTPGYTGEDDFGVHYKGIRNASIFLENIDMVTDMSTAEINQEKAEAMVLRAIRYHELMKRYGGIPLVTTALSVNDEIKIPRNTYEECVDFIVNQCDSALAFLPDFYSSNYTGRVTKGVALALKARTLLYAASPLHNTDQPYDETNRAYTGYTNYDESRWQKAAEANKAVLDWAQENSYHLITEEENPADNYRIAVEEPQNDEILFASQFNGMWYPGWLFSQFVMPTGVYGGWYGHGVTYEHAIKYYTATGGDQVWPESGSYEEFSEKMQDMEPRFQYSVLYSGSKFNDEAGVINFFRQNDGSWSTNAPVNGVGYMKKFLVKMTNNGAQFNWILFRLAEFYLNYAEALNEYSPLDANAFEALNVIRRRAGLPDITSADPQYNTQEGLRQAIRRERAIELAFEEHRFFDVRRWMIADQEGVMQGPMHGLNLYEQADNSLIYKKEVFETRVWNNRLYLYPLPQTEIDKGYMEQNPGW